MFKPPKIFLYSYTNHFLYWYLHLYINSFNNLKHNNTIQRMRNTPRSIFTSANSRFSRAISISLSPSSRCVLPTSESLPALHALTQLLKVDGASDNCLPASGIDKPPSITSFTASCLNSFVYFPYGILSILTPPLSYFTSTFGVHFFQLTSVYVLQIRTVYLLATHLAAEMLTETDNPLTIKVRIFILTGGIYADSKGYFYRSGHHAQGVRDSIGAQGHDKGDCIMRKITFCILMSW